MQPGCDLALLVVIDGECSSYSKMIAVGGADTWLVRRGLAGAHQPSRALLNSAKT